MAVCRPFYFIHYSSKGAQMILLVVLGILRLSIGLPVNNNEQCHPLSNRALSLDEIDELSPPRQPKQAAARGRRVLGRSLDEHESEGDGPPLSTEDLQLGRSLIGRHHKDAQLEEEAGFFEGDIVVPDATKGIADAIGHEWPSSTLPFALSNYLSRHARAAIAAGQEMITNSTCVRFRHKTTSDTDYVYYTSDTGCYSNIGRQGGIQAISIGPRCEVPGIAAHETLHSLGFFHEQSRADRDQFVTIRWPNIKPGDTCSNFFKQKQRKIHSNYDYLSVMHYRKNSFVRNRQSDMSTIVTKDPRYQAVIGQRNWLSPTDIQRVCDRYKCGRNCHPDMGYKIRF